MFRSLILYIHQHPVFFHITEHLNTETLETDPIEISKADRAKNIKNLVNLPGGHQSEIILSR